MTSTGDTKGTGRRGKRRLLLVIPINESKYDVPLKQYLEPYVAPDFRLDVRSIRKGQPHIASRWDLQVNGTHIAELVRRIGDRYDGIFISDFDGAGVEASRELVRVPVLDGFVPQCVAALALSHSFSIIAPDDGLVSVDVSHPRSMGTSEALASVRSIGMSLAELSDPANAELVVERVYEEAVDAIEEDGAHAILLGCTGMIGVASQVADRLRSREVSGVKQPLDVPVMDPNICGVTYLQSLVRAGLVQCGISYAYPSSLSPKA